MRLASRADLRSGAHFALGLASHCQQASRLRIVHTDYCTTTAYAPRNIFASGACKIPDFPKYLNVMEKKGWIPPIDNMTLPQQAQYREMIRYTQCGGLPVRCP